MWPNQLADMDMAPIQGIEPSHMLERHAARPLAFIGMEPPAGIEPATARLRTPRLCPLSYRGLEQNDEQNDDDDEEKDSAADIHGHPFSVRPRGIEPLRTG